MVPEGGTYKLEVWGAEGGAGDWTGGNKTEGYGGYSYGNIKLNAGQVLYVFVGQYHLGPAVYTCYNGGGTGSAPGGGATHIATTNRGELKNYQSYQNEAIIVAGGGGGLEWGGKGGDGGGTIGNNGNSQANSIYPQSTSASGGTQTSGGVSTAYAAWEGSSTLVNGSFGQGGYGYANIETDNDYGAGGGGGWYGGGGTSYSGAGGGGSGHLGSMLTNSSMQSGVQTGNGYARITQISFL